MMSKTSLLLFCALLPPAIFFFLIITLGVNIPQQDDFDSIFHYLLLSRDSLTSGLGDIHVSHRLVLTRLLALSSTALFGTLQLKLLMIVAGLALVACLLPLYHNFTAKPSRSYLLAVASLLIFSLFDWSNMLWATAGTQNYVGLFVALLAFNLFQRESTFSTAIALLLACIAPYIHSNGLLLLPLLLCWQLVCKRTPRSGHLIRPALIALLTALSVLIYFTAYSDKFDFGSSGNLVAVLLSFLVALAGYLHFSVLALIAGICIVSYCAYLTFTFYHRRNPFIYFSVCYLLLSLALVAFFRGGEGLTTVIASRYQLFTTMLLALLVCSFFELELDRKLPIPRVREIVLGACALFYLTSFYYLGNLTAERERIVAGVTHWQATGSASGLYHPEPERVAVILNQAIAAGLYRIPVE